MAGTGRGLPDNGSNVDLTSHRAWAFTKIGVAKLCREYEHV